MNEYNICYSLDSTYAEQLAVSVTSILQNANEEDNINFYILDGGLTISDKNKIRLLSNIKSFNIHYIDIDNEDFADCPLLKEKDEQYNDYHVTIPTYYRFKLSEFVPNLDKILYLDCDVIVRSSLEELYNTDITGFAAAMVIDAETEKEAQRLGIEKYFNAGVMLINLDYCKKNEIEKELFEYARNNKDTILWQDQDIINVVLKDKIKEIPNKWNFQYFQYENVDSKNLPECNIVHLAGRFKPWLMAFEHVLYDMYYHYLSFTAWKNKEIEYKLNSAGKYLKDNIGGKNTNIVVMTTDKDLQNTYKDLDNAYNYVQNVEKTISSNTDTKLSKVYDEIKKSYDFVQESIKDVEFKNTTETDDKISRVYEEIQNTYDYIKERVKDVQYRNTTETDDKISRVYDEIHNAYEYMQKIVNDVEFKNTNEINEKISQMYFEIKKAYEFVKDCIKDSESKTETNINEKVNNIYDEIKKLYDFINTSVKDSEFNLKSESNEKISEIYSEIEKIYEFIKNTAKDTEYKSEKDINEKIEKVYEEITKAYEFVKKCQKETEYNASIESDNKITLVYDEITKNYKYTEKLNNEVKSIIKETETKILNNTAKAYQVRELQDKYENLAKNTEVQNSLFEQILSDKIENTVNKTQKRIENVYDELDKANKYAEYLVEYASDKQEQKINNSISEILNKVENVKSETENNINAKADELYAYTDNQIKNVQDFIKSENISLSAQLSSESSAQYSELYTYTNEQNAKIFREITETSNYIENTLNNKIYDLYKNNETINFELSNLKNQINEKSDSNSVNRAIGELKNNISEKDYEYSQNLANIRNDFENKINQQRIKYENKLISMENQLAQMNKKLKEMKKSPIDKFLDKFRSKPEKRK